VSVLWDWFRLWLTYKAAPMDVLVLDMGMMRQKYPEQSLAIVKAVASMTTSRRYKVQRHFGPFRWYVEVK